MHYNITKQYWPQGEGILTHKGAVQHYELGKALRRKYIIDNKLLSPSYDHSQIKAYSTSINRTYESAKAQLLGLYPPADASSLGFKTVEEEYNYMVK